MPGLDTRLTALEASKQKSKPAREMTTAELQAIIAGDLDGRAPTYRELLAIANSYSSEAFGMSSDGTAALTAAGRLDDI